METWFVNAVFLCVATLIISILFRRSHRKKLPPGPSLLHSTYLLLTNSFLKFEPILVDLKAKYGPFFTLSTGIGPSIFVGSHSLAHQILIQKGAVFADRHKTFAIRNISTTSYGPTWRILRRNLATEMMHPNRINSYSWCRKWALNILITRLLDQQDAAGVNVVDHFHCAILSLLVFMCFGQKLDESEINKIAKVQRDMLKVISSGRFTVLTIFPKLGKILFRNKWKEFERWRNDEEQLFIPLIESRIETINSEHRIVAYVDSLVDIQLPEKEKEKEEEEADYGNGGKLTHKEIVSMCSEILNGGTDTTVAVLQWIMANLVKHPHIQRKLYDEIVAVVGPPVPPSAETESVVNEEDLKKMPYLKSVVLEGLRRHPPGHFLFPHRVMEEVEVQGFMIPKGATINFMVGEMGLDPKVWDEPMEFKPERFMVNDGVFDMSGSKEIKMMPFGAGRRICPGSDLVLLHLEYFVANLIWYFEWTAPDGYHVDLSEKNEFTIVMEHPLQAQISPRAEKLTT